MNWTFLGKLGESWLLVAFGRDLYDGRWMRV